MQRLTGLDASFLYMETPSSHMHVAGLMIFDPSTAPGGCSFDEVKDVYATRLHLAPPFRRRLVEVPFGLHHPLWIEDPDFDLDFHIRHIAVPRPAAHAAAGRRSPAELVALPLDRSRPLWEMWVIEGLEDGYVAVLTKVHHAAIDGASGNELTVALLDLDARGSRDAEPEQAWKPDRVPTDAELLGYAAALARAPAGPRLGQAGVQPHGGAVAVRRPQPREPDVDAAAGAVHRARARRSTRAITPAPQLRLHVACRSPTSRR